MWYLQYEMLLVLSFSSSTICAERVALVGVQDNTSGFCGYSGMTVGNFMQATTLPCDIQTDHTQQIQSQSSARAVSVRARGGVGQSKSGQRFVGLAESGCAIGSPASCPWINDRTSRAKTRRAAWSSSIKLATRVGSSIVLRDDGFGRPLGCGSMEFDFASTSPSSHLWTRRNLDQAIALASPYSNPCQMRRHRLSSEHGDRTSGSSFLVPPLHRGPNLALIDGLTSTVLEEAVRSKVSDARVAWSPRRAQLATHSGDGSSDMRGDGPSAGLPATVPAPTTATTVGAIPP